MSFKIESSINTPALETNKLSRFSTLVSSLALSFSAMVANLDTVNAQAPAPVLVEQSDDKSSEKFTDYTTYQFRLYLDDNRENMYEVMPFVRGKFNYLLPVDFTNAGLYMASTHFSDKKEPLHLEMSRMGIGAYYENGEIESFTQAYLLMNCLFDLKFLVEFNSHLNSDGVESSFLPSIVYNNERLYIGFSKLHADLRVNVSNFLLRTRISNSDNFSVSTAYNLKQVKGVRTQDEYGFSYEVNYKQSNGVNYFFLTVGRR